MTAWNYRKGLHDIGHGCYAYLQPTGGWGYSNAGLITSDGDASLIDTLFDLPLTREMLEAMNRQVPQMKGLNKVINTHSHPDHTAGNCLCMGCEFIASEATKQELERMKGGDDPIQKVLDNWQHLGDGGAYMQEVMGSRFELGSREIVLPTTSFASEMVTHVGGREVRLKHVGPAHSRGDTLVHLPREKVLFAGDVLFHEVHPAIISNTIAGWVEACDHILTLDVEVIVPGHGPIAEMKDVRVLRDYLGYFQTEARKRYDLGMSVHDAARDISIDAYKGWADEERIFITISNLYTSFGAPPAPMLEVMGMAGRYRKEKIAAGEAAA